MEKTGILNRAAQSKLLSGIAKVEEIARLRVQELYAQNAENLDAVNEETITTAVINVLDEKGYPTEVISTTTQTVKGLLIQDSSGNNIDKVSTIQNGETTIKIALDTEGNTTSKTYVKIENRLFELSINGGKVEISREEYIRQPQDEDSYQIKLTPPTSGAKLYVGTDEITADTLPIVPGTAIKVKAGGSTGTYTFSVAETKTSVNRTVSIEVKSNPEYATGLSIAVKDGAAAEIEAGETLQLIATKTPAGSTDTISWSIKSGSATIDKITGLVTANADAVANSTIVVGATCVRADKTTTTVGEKTLTITVKAKAGESEGSTVNQETKVGYYADVDNNGTVDGVIFADLAVGGSGKWNNDSSSAYTIPTKTGLKSYYIKKATYNDGHFGDHPVIAPVDGTSGNDRFYVMALSDISSLFYYWDYDYHDIYYGTSYNFGSGKENTRKLIDYWNDNPTAGSNGEYYDWNSDDIWPNIQSKYNKGWFVPSKEEWSAFGANLGITSSNYYKTFGLEDIYWSSSQRVDDYNAWYADFHNGYLNYYNVHSGTYVRLATTF